MQIIESCQHCGESKELTRYFDIMGEGPLCYECARRDILGWIVDCEQNEIDLLAKRAKANSTEDIVDSIAKGYIDYEDII